MTDNNIAINITFERGSEREPGAMFARFNEGQGSCFTGPLTIELPGKTAIRIDLTTRTVAVNRVSGDTSLAEPCLPDWFIADLRDGTYGDFHRLLPRHECFDPGECAASGQHNALYPHLHETIEEFGDCQECVMRAADLRFLADV